MAAVVERNRQLEERLVEARRFAKWGGVCAVVGMVGCVTVVAIGVTFFPRVKHVKVDSTEALCTIESTPQPVVSVGLVTDFAKECLLDLDGWGFDDYERRLTQATSRCLTPEFRKAYMTNPTLSSRISTVRDAVLRVKPMTENVPQIESEGEGKDGAYRWVVQVPLRRTYIQGGTKKSEQSVLYNATVVKVPRQAYNPVGLAIESLVEKPGYAR